MVSDIPDQTIDEGQSFAPIHLDDYVSDPDNSDDEMTWTYSGNKDLTVSIDSNRVATVTVPDTNWNGSETITFTATDPGGLSDSDSAVFNVRSVDDPPKFSEPLPTISFNEDDSLFIAWKFWYPYVSDPDTPDSLLDFNMLGGQNVQALHEENGRWLQAGENWFGRDTLIIIAGDHFFLDSASFLVNVLPVNDPPQIINFPDSLTFNKNDTLILNLRPLVQDVDSPADSLFWTFEMQETMLRVEYEHSTQTAYLFSKGFVGYTHLMCTVTDPDGAFDRDTTMVHVKDTGTGLEDGEQGVVKAFRLLQNFPNPFNPTTTVQFALKQSGRAVLDVFSIDGKKVATVLDQNLPAGIHSFKIKANNWASGIYFYRLLIFRHNQIIFSRVKKMILLK